MLQLIGGHWPAEWQPRGWGSFDHEPFASWWERWGHQFPDLDPRVVEQWVHRHWAYSDYFGFPLQDFRCDIERLPTSVLISNVGSVDYLRPDETLDLDYIHKNFNEGYGSGHEPTKTMNPTGTWDIPVLLVRSASGFAYRKVEFPHFPLWLLEGHQRHRYLRALAARGEAAECHDALVLTRHR